MISKQQLISLSSVKGVGPARIRYILRKYPHISDIKELTRNDLCQVESISIEIANKILKFDEKIGEEALTKTENMDAQFIPFWDDNYPKLLATIYDAPAGIFVKGVMPGEPTVAVVGTRNPTEYGKKITRNLVNGLVKAGLVITSGFARGIDTIAHSEAIKGGGKTIAVLGNGLDFCYPAENKKLQPSLLENGVFMSEFIPTTKPDAVNFPKRNRIISGLSLGVIVIEAGKKSGSVITAYNALDQNREVFAVPGNINSPRSYGTNKLIQNGAKLTMSVDDILNELQICKPLKQCELIPKLTPEEIVIYEKLKKGPIHIDDLCLQLQKDSPEVLTVLLSLELYSIVTQQPGKIFTIN